MRVAKDIEKNAFRQTENRIALQSKCTRKTKTRPFRKSQTVSMHALLIVPTESETICGRHIIQPHLLKKREHYEFQVGSSLV